jgi:hypothetical protein
LKRTIPERPISVSTKARMMYSESKLPFNTF